MASPAPALPSRSTLKPLQELTGHVLPILATCYNTRRHHLLTADAETLRLWSLRKELRRVPAAGVVALAYEPNHDLFVGFHADGVALYHPSLALLCSAPSPSGAIVAGAVCEARSEVVSSTGGEVQVWSVSKTQGGESDLQLRGSLSDHAQGPPIEVLQVDAGCELLLGAAENSVWIWDLATCSVVHALDGMYTARITCLQYDARDDEVVAGYEDGRVNVWSLTPPASGPGEAAASPPPGGGGGGGGEEIMRTPTLRKYHTGHAEGVAALLLTRERGGLCSCGRGGSVRHWNYESGRELGRYAGTASKVSAAARRSARPPGGRRRPNVAPQPPCALIMAHVGVGTGHRTVLIAAAGCSISVMEVLAPTRVFASSSAAVVSLGLGKPMDTWVTDRDVGEGRPEGMNREFVCLAQDNSLQIMDPIEGRVLRRLAPPRRKDVGAMRQGDRRAQDRADRLKNASSRPSGVTGGLGASKSSVDLGMSGSVDSRVGDLQRSGSLPRLSQGSTHGGSTHTARSSWGGTVAPNTKRLRRGRPSETIRDPSIADADVTCFTWSPGLGAFVVGWSDGCVHLMDPTSGESLDILSDDSAKAPVTCICVLPVSSFAPPSPPMPDWKKEVLAGGGSVSSLPSIKGVRRKYVILTGTPDGTLCLWDDRPRKHGKRRLLHSVDAHSAPLVALALIPRFRDDDSPTAVPAPSLACVVTGSTDGMCKLWTLEMAAGGGGSLIQTSSFLMHSAATGGPKQIQQSTIMGGGGLSSLCVPRGTGLLVGGLDGGVMQVWALPASPHVDPPPTAPLATFAHHAAKVTTLQHAASGAGFLSASLDGTVTLWRADMATVTRSGETILYSERGVARESIRPTCTTAPRYGPITPLRTVSFGSPIVSACFLNDNNEVIVAAGDALHVIEAGAAVPGGDDVDSDWTNVDSSSTVPPQPYDEAPGAEGPASAAAAAAGFKGAVVHSATSPVNKPVDKPVPATQAAPKEGAADTEGGGQQGDRLGLRRAGVAGSAIVAATLSNFGLGPEQLEASLELQAQSESLSWGYGHNRDAAANPRPVVQVPTSAAVQGVGPGANGRPHHGEYSQRGDFGETMPLMPRDESGAMEAAQLGGGRYAPSPLPPADDNHTLSMSVPSQIPKWGSRENAPSVPSRGSAQRDQDGSDAARAMSPSGWGRAETPSDMQDVRLGGRRVELADASGANDRVNAVSSSGAQVPRRTVEAFKADGASRNHYRGAAKLTTVAAPPPLATLAPLTALAPRGMDNTPLGGLSDWQGEDTQVDLLGPGQIDALRDAFQMYDAERSGFISIGSAALILPLVSRWLAPESLLDASFESDAPSSPQSPQAPQAPDTSAPSKTPQPFTAAELTRVDEFLQNGAPEMLTSTSLSFTDMLNLTGTYMQVERIRIQQRSAQREEEAARGAAAQMSLDDFGNATHMVKQTVRYNDWGERYIELVDVAVSMGQLNGSNVPDGSRVLSESTSLALRRRLRETRTTYGQDTAGSSAHDLSYSQPQTSTSSRTSTAESSQQPSQLSVAPPSAGMSFAGEWMARFEWEWWRPSLAALALASSSAASREPVLGNDTRRTGPTAGCRFALPRQISDLHDLKLTHLPRSERELRKLNNLPDLVAKQNAGGAVPLRPLFRFLQQLHKARLAAIRAAGALIRVAKGDPRAMASAIAAGSATLSSFLYDWHIKLYGLPELAGRKLLTLLASLVAHAGVPQCRLFARLLGVFPDVPLAAGAEDMYYRILAWLHARTGDAAAGASESSIHVPLRYILQPTAAPWVMLEDPGADPTVTLISMARCRECIFHFFDTYQSTGAVGPQGGGLLDALICAVEVLPAFVRGVDGGLSPFNESIGGLVASVSDSDPLGRYGQWYVDAESFIEAVLDAHKAATWQGGHLSPNSTPALVPSVSTGPILLPGVAQGQHATALTAKPPLTIGADGSASLNSFDWVAPSQRDQDSFELFQRQASAALQLAASDRSGGSVVAGVQGLLDKLVAADRHCTGLVDMATFCHIVARSSLWVVKGQGLSSTTNTPSPSMLEAVATAFCREEVAGVSYLKFWSAYFAEITALGSDKLTRASNTGASPQSSLDNLAWTALERLRNSANGSLHNNASVSYAASYAGGDPHNGTRTGGIVSSSALELARMDASSEHDRMLDLSATVVDSSKYVVQDDISELNVSHYSQTVHAVPRRDAKADMADWTAIPGHSQHCRCEAHSRPKRALVTEAPPTIARAAREKAREKARSLDQDEFPSFFNMLASLASTGWDAPNGEIDDGASLPDVYPPTRGTLEAGGDLMADPPNAESALSLEVGAAKDTEEAGTADAMGRGGHQRVEVHMPKQLSESLPSKGKTQASKPRTRVGSKAGHSHTAVHASVNRKARTPGPGSPGSTSNASLRRVARVPARQTPTPCDGPGALGNENTSSLLDRSQDMDGLVGFVERANDKTRRRVIANPNDSLVGVDPGTLMALAQATGGLLRVPANLPSKLRYAISRDRTNRQHAMESLGRAKTADDEQGKRFKREAPSPKTPPQETAKPRAKQPSVLGNITASALSAAQPPTVFESPSALPEVSLEVKAPEKTHVELPATPQTDVAPIQVAPTVANVPADPPIAKMPTEDSADQARKDSDARRVAEELRTAEELSTKNAEEAAAHARMGEEEVRLAKARAEEIAREAADEEERKVREAKEVEGQQAAEATAAVAAAEDEARRVHEAEENARKAEEALQSTAAAVDDTEALPTAADVPLELPEPPVIPEVSVTASDVPEEVRDEKPKEPVAEAEATAGADAVVTTHTPIAAVETAEEVKQDEETEPVVEVHKPVDGVVAEEPEGAATPMAVVVAAEHSDTPDEDPRQVTPPSPEPGISATAEVTLPTPETAEDEDSAEFTERLALLNGGIKAVHNTDFVSDGKDDKDTDEVAPVLPDDGTPDPQPIIDAEDDAEGDVEVDVEVDVEGDVEVDVEGDVEVDVVTDVQEAAETVVDVVSDASRRSSAASKSSRRSSKRKSSKSSGRSGKTRSSASKKGGEAAPNFEDVWKARQARLAASGKVPAPMPEHQAEPEESKELIDMLAGLSDEEEGGAEAGAEEHERILDMLKRLDDERRAALERMAEAEAALVNTAAKGNAKSAKAAKEALEAMQRAADEEAAKLWELEQEAENARRNLRRMKAVKERREELKASQGSKGKPGREHRARPLKLVKGKPQFGLTFSDPISVAPWKLAKGDSWLPQWTEGDADDSSEGPDSEDEMQQIRNATQQRKDLEKNDREGADRLMYRVEEFVGDDWKEWPTVATTTRPLWRKFFADEYVLLQRELQDRESDFDREQRLKQEHREALRAKAMKRNSTASRFRRASANAMVHGAAVGANGGDSASPGHPKGGRKMSTFRQHRASRMLSMASGSVIVTDVAVDGQLHVREIGADQWAYYKVVIPADEFTLSVDLETLAGDPDLFISLETVPSSVDFTWKSSGVGNDRIKVFPEDARFKFGDDHPYYIGVFSNDDSCEFALSCTVISSKYESKQLDTVVELTTKFSAIGDGLRARERARRSPSPSPPPVQQEVKTRDKAMVEREVAEKIGEAKSEAAKDETILGRRLVELKREMKDIGGDAADFDDDEDEDEDDDEGEDSFLPMGIDAPQMGARLSESRQSAQSSSGLSDEDSNDGDLDENKERVRGMLAAKDGEFDPLQMAHPTSRTLKKSVKSPEQKHVKKKWPVPKSPSRPQYKLPRVGGQSHK